MIADNISRNNKMVATIVGIIAIFAAIWGSISTVNSYEFRITSLEKNYAMTATAIHSLTDQIKELNSSIINLNLNIRELQIRQELVNEPRN